MILISRHNSISSENVFGIKLKQTRIDVARVLEIINVWNIMNYART